MTHFVTHFVTPFVTHFVTHFVTPFVTHFVTHFVTLYLTRLTLQVSTLVPRLRRLTLQESSLRTPYFAHDDEEREVASRLPLFTLTRRGKSPLACNSPVVNFPDFENFQEIQEKSRASRPSKTHKKFVWRQSGNTKILTRHKLSAYQVSAKLKKLFVFTFSLFHFQRRGEGSRFATSSPLANAAGEVTPRGPVAHCVLFAPRKYP